jgi:hypothetical protein
VDERYARTVADQLQVARDLRSSREPKLIDSRPLKQLKKPDDKVPEKE